MYYVTCFLSLLADQWDNIAEYTQSMIDTCTYKTRAGQPILFHGVTVEKRHTKSSLRLKRTFVKGR